MGCCGGKRAALKATRTPRPAGRPDPPIRPVSPPASTELLRYSGGEPLVVHGVSGAAYGFSPAQSIQAVRAEDVARLIGMGLFARVA